MTETTVQSLRDLRILASAETKGVQWPTFLQAGFVIAGTATSSLCALAGYIPFWIATILNAFFMTVGYTYVHECAHKNMHGRIRSLRWINDVLGFVGFAFPMHSYTMHVHIHRLHHMYTNDRERDADAYVSDAPNFLSAVLRGLTFYFYSNWFAVKTAHLARNPRIFLLKCAAETAVPYAIAIALALNGYAFEVLMLWFLPSVGTFAGVSMFVDWIPHHVKDKSDPIKNTAIIVAPKTLLGHLMKWCYGFHNYHLIHHLVPSAPWYTQERLFEASKEVLTREGARIRYA